MPRAVPKTTMTVTIAVHADVPAHVWTDEALRARLTRGIDQLLELNGAVSVKVDKPTTTDEVPVEKGRPVRGPASNNTSGYKGVSWKKATGRWKATISVDRKRRELGYFDTAVEAAQAYDAAALELLGEHAWLNFPKTPAALRGE